MIVRVIRADIADVRAEAICTSTNPRLSLYEGTGGAVREKGGFEIKRECEAVLEAEAEKTGRSALGVGSVHVTGAGSLPATIIIHCVASDAHHRSSREIIAACVGNALVRAHDRGCESIAMPIFATGHASFRFQDAVEAMAGAILGSRVRPAVLTIAVVDADQVAEVRQVLRRTLGDEATLEEGV